VSVKLSTRQVGDVSVVDVAGRITLGEGSSALRETLREMVGKNQKKILLNLGDVSYIDSSGIGELVSGFTTVTNSGGQLKLLNLNKRVKDLLQYFPVLLQALVAMLLAAGLITVSYLLGKRVKNRVKDMPYESGIVPTGDARQRFSVKFYLVAMLFIVFDIEAIFLYPWAVVYRELKMPRLYRNADFCNPDPFRVLLHLEKGRAGLVRGGFQAKIVDNSKCYPKPCDKTPSLRRWKRSMPTPSPRASSTAVN
jgi:anti-sigma B factor antagonist